MTHFPALPSAALDELVLAAEKPSRYIGTEFGAVHKDLDQARVRFALAFPDTYEVGMSNLGFRLLYHLLNDRPEVACERVFLPWPDMEGMLAARGIPLFTLESRAPVKAFDVLGITLQFELAYTSVLAMLDLAGVPLLAAERAEDDPLVVGGGPCAFNPEPVADFFDCFVLGDGEEVAVELAAAVAESGFRRGGASRRELLARLARDPGRSTSRPSSRRATTPCPGRSWPSSRSGPATSASSAGWCPTSTPSPPAPTPARSCPSCRRSTTGCPSSSSAAAPAGAASARWG